MAFPIHPLHRGPVAYFLLIMELNFQVNSNFSEVLGPFFQRSQHSDIFLLADPTTKRKCLPQLKAHLPEKFHLLTLPAGETHKTLQSCEKVWQFLTRHKADRKALIINLGGGVLGDLGGFAASVYKRGIDVVQIPTTLLAMVDASLGGKTGIDFMGFKNHLGTFRQPLDIWIFPSFLTSLPKEEKLSGFAEIIKHHLISDEAGWNKLRKTDWEYLDWPNLIRHSLETKKNIVMQDPFEKGERKKLNAGHTLGHAIESLFLAQHSPIPHGFAVAAGLVIEGFIAFEKGWLPENQLAEIEEFIFSVFGKLSFRKADFNKILANCRQDKKNQDGRISLSLVGPIGQCQTTVYAQEGEIKRALNYYLG